MDKNKFNERDLLWLNESSDSKPDFTSVYGDVTELNTERTILDLVGKETLAVIVSDLMDLLETSVAVYEKNGDYAFGLFNSGWCRLMDSASRKLCHTDDNKIALNCGKWLCHEDCWNNSAKVAIESKKATDIDCIGGIKLYAEPIFVNDEVVGTINIGYGNPPKDDDTLQKLANDYNIELDVLKAKSDEYNPRPRFIIEIAKKRLISVAKLIGEIIARKKTEQALKESEAQKKAILNGISANIAFVDLDFRINWVNKAAAKSANKKADEMIGKHCYSFWANSNKVCDECPSVKVIETKQKEHKIMTTPDGRVWDESGEPVFDAKGNLIGIVEIAQDITEKIKAEHALIESEARFKNMFERHNAIMLLIEPETGVIVDANDSATRFYGYKKSVLCSKTINELNILSPEQVLAERENAITEKRNQFTFPHKLANAEIRTVEVHSSPIEFQNNRILFSIIHDITERKKAEQALKESEEHYRRILETVPIMLYDYVLYPDGSGKFLYVGPSCKEIFEVDEKEFLSDINNFWKMIHPDDLQRAIDEDIAANKAGVLLVAEIRIITPSGKLKWIQMSSRPNPTTNDEPAVWSGYALDITQRKKAEQTLKESEERFKGAFETAKHGMAIVDINGYFIQINQSFCDIVGYTKEEMLTFDFKKITHPDDLEIDINHVNQLLSNKIQSYQLEKRYFHKNGQIVWIILSVSLVRDVNNEPIHFVSQVIDITKRKKTEQALKESEEISKKALMQANQFIEVLDNLPSYVYFKNTQHQYIYANKICLDLFNKTKETIYGCTDSEFFPPETVTQLWDIDRQVLEYGKTTNEEVIVKNDEKNLAVYLEMKFPLYDEENNISGLCGISTDISEIKKFQKKLIKAKEKAEENELLLNETGNLAKVGGWKIDLKTQKHTWTKEVYKILELPFDYKPSMEEGINYYDDNSKKIIQKALDEAIEYGKPYNLDLGVYTAKGNKKQVKVIGKIQCDAKGKPELIFGSFQDITEQKYAEQALKDSEAKLKTIIDTIPDLLFLLDKSGTYIDFYQPKNKKYYLEPEEFLGKSIYEFWEPELALKIENAISEAFLNDYFEFEYELYPDEKRNYHARLAKLDNNTVLALISDITESKKAEQALKESEEKYRFITDSINDLVWKMDMKTNKVTYASPAVLNNTGYTVEEFSSMKMDDLMTPESLKIAKQQITDRIKKLLKGDKSAKSNIAEYQMINKDGSKVWTETSTTFLFDDSVVPVELIGVSRDISVRKQAEQILKESHELVSLFIKHSPIYTFIKEVSEFESKVIHASENYIDMIGITGTEMVGKTMEELFPPEFAEKITADDWQVIKQGEILRLDEELNDKNYITIKFPIIQGDKHLLAGYTIDITDRKKAEQALKESEGKLKILNADKDRFMQILAHDLRSPFNALLGFSDLLLENIHEYDKNTIESELKIIQQTANKTFNLLTDLLLWSQSQSGKLTFRAQKIVFGEICNHIINNLKNQADKKEISIHFFEAEKAIINADLNMLKTILRNLISNAIKFTDKKGEINIYTEKNKEYVTITVSDNGVGIKEENIPHLWDFTTPISTIGTSEEEGTGFGLLLCKEFTEKHGGKIWAESEIGVGSDFIFTMPLHKG